MTGAKMPMPADDIGLNLNLRVRTYPRRRA
jgi:hypothetical protein